jgi:hypothetical protein
LLSGEKLPSLIPRTFAHQLGLMLLCIANFSASNEPKLSNHPSAAAAVVAQYENKKIKTMEKTFLYEFIRLDIRLALSSLALCLANLFLPVFFLFFSRSNLERL